MKDIEKQHVQDLINLLSYNNFDLDDDSSLEKLKSLFDKLNIQQKMDKIKKIEDEPFLNPEARRFTVFPLTYHDIWEMYKLQLSSFWKAEEIDFSKDYDDYMQLNENEQQFIKMILAFFAASDGLINFNLRERFLNEVQVMEVQIAYSFQMMMENIHGEVYSLMLDNIIRDKEEKAKLFNAIETISSVKKMADWAMKWIQSSDSFAHRVIAFAIVEGIFFSGAFASVFWFKNYKAGGKSFLQGLIQSNDFISRDEAMHYDFACLIYSHLKNKLSISEVYAILDDAVIISKEFMNDALPCRLIGMNNDLMNDYIEYIADTLLIKLNYTKKYYKSNPFSFMNNIGLVGKTNFFEKRATEYQSAFVFNKSTRGKPNLSENF